MILTALSLASLVALAQPVPAPGVPATSLAPLAFDMATLDRGIARCERATVTPLLAGEGARRARFAGEVYAEQAAIAALRADIVARRRALREGVATTDTAPRLDQLSAAIDDRQHLLDDRRQLEQLLTEAVEAKRRHFLTTCANGKS
jgi:hypothetical protein